MLVKRFFNRLLSTVRCHALQNFWIFVENCLEMAARSR